MTAATDRVSAQVEQLVEIYADDPFSTIERARARLGVDRRQMSEVLAGFHTSPRWRERLLSGPSTKYWTNTILPLERAGVLDAVLTRQTVYPYRVGLYPGPSCMFRCGFCVRVTGARYGADEIADGNERFARIIDELPTDDPHRMYLSGGLEPLTNPGIGTLVSRAAGRGLSLALYTNAFALTPQTLDRQPGLWDLGALRVSLYGLDEDEYTRTTGKRGFERVSANVTELLRQRAQRGGGPQVGLNYIILPGSVDRLPALIRQIAEWNTAAPDRPIDFLTLREDYSGRDGGRLPAAERIRLRDALGRFTADHARLAPTLRLDLGYALEAVAAGADAQMVRVRADELRPGAHPQAAAQIDLRGDVYLYREAGFPGLAGAERYSAGRVDADTGLLDVLRTFVERGRAIPARPGDEYFLDGFDQAVTVRLRQLEADIAHGWADHRGLVR